ncbi:MAG: EFR1 family ferrodoxin [Promethearchaeota archaeon]
MNVLIIYFSQTGNTKKIAKKIRKGILKSGNECELVRIKDVNKKNLENIDLIGIGTPTFLYREPRNIKKFIQELDEMNGKHCFLFCTHGSQIGNTFYYMNEELNKKGFVVINTFDSYASSSLQFYPYPMHTTGHPDEIELNDAVEFGKKICDVSNRIKRGELKLLPKFELISDTWWASESNKLTLDVLRKISPKFKINVDKCTKCLKCQENCPVDAIDIEASPPQIQKEGCIFCWFCEKSCPVNAIEADWSYWKENSKKNLLRYIEILKEAEKEGKFRPYIDYQSMY